MRVSNPVHRMTRSGSKRLPSAKTTLEPSKRSTATARRHFPIAMARTNSSSLVPNCSATVPPDSSSSRIVIFRVSRLARTALRRVE